ncbi:hypothetical protein [Thioalkalivibrio paradoxus]|uniref:Uncharacterized protein n=1 Tax=Thioalkalivibrio paradoxus ARh 1 TaxID=713585 RepID=W0DSS0_9GAMM|nr:hypothetical protein [Thioalkalivibrio paradoxus]AHF00034.1 hypothetical protein THITH_07025 [Thioalkalivibrio paradoxus ARh 1]
MEENEFKTIFSGYDPQRCHFNKAILLGCAGCSRSQRVLIAEREALSCLSRAGHARCGELLGLLREKAAFALGITQVGQRLPHGKEMKVECGGLQALSALSGHADPGDIDAILQAAIRQYGSLAEIPYGEVVRAVSRYALRKRSGNRRPGE